MSLAEYNNWDPIERCERTKLATGEDGMIWSDLLVYKAGTGATRGYIGGVSLWEEFYTQDKVRFCGVRASRYEGSIPAVLVLRMGVSGVLGPIGSLWWVTALLMRLPVGDLAFSGLGLRSRLYFDFVKHIPEGEKRREGGLHSTKRSDIWSIV